MLSPSRLLALTALLIVGLAQFQVIDNQTANSAGQTWTTFQGYCQGSANSNLQRCNNTCDSCESSSASQCSTCMPEFSLSGFNCRLDLSIYDYFYTSYADSWQNDETIADAFNFNFQSSGDSLGFANTVGLCQQNQYQSYMYGLFSESQQIELSFSRKDNIDRVQVKLNLISVVKGITFQVHINDNSVFTQTFSEFGNVDGTYARGNATQQNYVNIPSLNSNTAGNIIVLVDTGTIGIETKGVTVRLTATKGLTSGTASSFWGFNDVVVVERDCQTCVTDQVQSLLNNLGIIILIVGAVVFVLIALLFIMIRVEEWKKKQQFKEKLGSASGNLPDKAINRVLDSLAKYRILKRQEQAKFDAEFAKGLKQGGTVGGAKTSKIL